MFRVNTASRSASLEKKLLMFHEEIQQKKKGEKTRVGLKTGLKL